MGGERDRLGALVVSSIDFDVKLTSIRLLIDFVLVAHGLQPAHFNLNFSLSLVKLDVVCLSFHCLSLLISSVLSICQFLLTDFIFSCSVVSIQG
jgi:hypothetical protein